MKNKYSILIWLTWLLTIFSGNLSAQETNKKLDLGFSIGILNWNNFYNSENPFSREFTKSVAWYPMFDVVVGIPLASKFNSGLIVSNLRKLNTTKGGIPYKLDYLTVSPFGSFVYTNKNQAKISIGAGPYAGYIYHAKKGDQTLTDDDLKNWEYGIQLLITLGNTKQPKYNYIQTIKFQYGMNDVFFFKTMSVTMSYYGLSMRL